MNKAERMEVRLRCEVVAESSSDSERMKRLLHIAKFEIPQLLGVIESLEWHMQFMGYPCKRCGMFTQEGHRIITAESVDMYCNACWGLTDEGKEDACEAVGFDLEKLHKILESGEWSPEREKARKKFRAWLDGASKLSAEDFNLVLKTTEGILKETEV